MGNARVTEERASEEAAKGESFVGKTLTRARARRD